MLVLDTNVLSELLKPTPDEQIVSWIERQPRQQLFTTVVSRAEILYGILLLPNGQRRQKLADAAKAVFDEALADHVLPFDNTAADHFAAIAARRKVEGKPISQFDAIIVSIAAAHSARLATRNVRDFEGCGVEIENPWDGYCDPQ
jgi:predicted nucleic acid-binding protein